MRKVVGVGRLTHLENMQTKQRRHQQHEERTHPDVQPRPGPLHRHNPRFPLLTPKPGLDLSKKSTVHRLHPNSFQLVVLLPRIVSTHGEADEESDAEDQSGKRNDEAVFGTGREITFERALAAVGSVCAKRHVERIDGVRC